MQTRVILTMECMFRLNTSTYLLTFLPVLLMSDLWMCGMTPPPAMVACAQGQVSISLLVLLQNIVAAALSYASLFEKKKTQL